MIKRRELARAGFFQSADIGNKPFPIKRPFRSTPCKGFRSVWKLTEPLFREVVSIHRNNFRLGDKSF
eukprot:gene9296-6658_t